MELKIFTVAVALVQIACLLGILWVVRAFRLPFGWDRRCRRKLGISREDIWEGRDGYGNEER